MSKHKLDTYTIGSGSSITVAKDYGCNMLSWKVNGNEMLYHPKPFPDDLDSFYKGGNPILFPSVGRTWDTTTGQPLAGIYKIYGRKDTLNMPFHGILTLTEWDLSATVENEESVKVTYEMRTPDIVQEMAYPYDITLKMIYELSEKSVQMEAQLVNNGDHPAPYAFGLHPFFALAGTDRKGVRMSLPAKTQILLNPELLVPDGRTDSAISEFDLEPGKDYDCVYGDMQGTRATLIDDKAGHKIHVDFDENIENLVVYAGDGKPFVCLEPWTRGLGAYSRLNEKNWMESGCMNILQSKDEKSIVIRYSVE